MAIGNAPKPNNTELEQKEKIKFNILMAEDDINISNLLKIFIESEGHKLVIVPNGKLLMEELRKPGASFDIVLTDNTMPEKTGLEALREIRASAEGFKNIPVIVATSDHFGTIQTDVEALGAIFMAKPVKPRNLLRTIDEIMESRQK